MKNPLLVLFILSMTVGYSQKTNSSFNFGFEERTPGSSLPVGWQVRGGMGYLVELDTVEKHSGKTSIRIRRDTLQTSKTLGIIGQTIPITFEGNEVELQGYLKLNKVSNGPVAFSIQTDGRSGNLGFNNLNGENLEGTIDWKLYSVKLPLPDNAKTIFIGASLSGEGQIWADDFQLLIDGHEIGKVKTAPPKEFKAEQDKEFDNLVSTIPNLKLSASKIENLSLLGKVWGFLKYYHPKVAEGQYNWDYELFRIMPKIIESPTSTKANEVLSNWIDSFGNIPEEAFSETIKDVKLLPDFSWIKKARMGKALNDQLLGVKKAKHTKNYYVSLVTGSGNAQFKNESTYSAIGYPDAGFRLLSLFRYWNMIQYYFPYRNLLDDNWNDVLTEFIPKFVDALSQREYNLAVLELIARVHDTHANILVAATAGMNFAPLEINFVEGKAVVVDYYDDDLGGKTGLRKGDVIEAINNKSITDIVKERLPLTPASNFPTQLREIAPGLLKTEDSFVSITYSREGSVKTSDVKTISHDRINFYQKAFPKDSCFRLISPDIAYLFPGTIKNKYLPELLPKISGTKGLIIDLRCYPSEFIVFSLSEFLLPHPTPFAKFSQGSVSTPGLFTMQAPVVAGTDNPGFYKGKVVILINETTQSQAEYTTMAFRTSPKAIIIGSQTAGADGNTSAITLPGNLRTAISGIGVYYPDGKETQRIGIIPDIEVKPTIKGITEGRDEVLEKAIELINKN